MRKERLLLCMSRIGPRSVRESRTETALVSFPDGRTPFPPLVLLVKTTTLGCVESAVQSSSSPQAQAVTFQLLANRMFVYLHGDPSLNYDPRNLFALRCDLHSCLFDQAQFFLSRNLLTSSFIFVRISQESVQQYHNVIFDHNHALSHELLYARFVWALIKTSNCTRFGSKRFKFSDTSKSRHPDSENDNPGTGAGARDVRKCKRRYTNEDEDSNIDDGDHGITSAAW
jgi:hypothetical protein